MIPFAIIHLLKLSRKACAYKTLFSLLLLMFFGGRVFAAGVPAGFESLMEKQGVIVDVLYQGNFISTASADYEPGTLYFNNAQKIVSLLSDVKEQQQDYIISKLSESLADNVALLCVPVKLPGCGRLELTLKNPVGVIYNPATFKALLFIHPSLLEISTVAEKEYFDSPTSGLSMVNRLNGAYSYSVAEQQKEGDSTISLYSIVAYNNAHLALNAYHSTLSRTYLENALFEYDAAGYFWGGGLYQSDGSSLTDSTLMYGGKVSTSRRTAINREQEQGSNLVIYLTQPSQVEIWRDDRLLNVGAYDAGNQQLDTRSLPNGTYVVRLRVRDAGGISKEEQRLFVKSIDIPPVGYPLYKASVGKEAIKDDNSGIPAAQGNYWADLKLVNHVDNNYALSSTMMAVGSSQSLELSSDIFLRDTVLKGALLATSNKNYAGTFLFSAEFGTAHLNGKIVQTWISDGEDDIPVSYLANGSTSEYYSQLSFSLPLKSNLSITGSYTSNEINPNAIYSYGATFSAEVFNYADSRGILNTSFNQADDDTVFHIGIDISFTKPNYAYRLSSGYQQQAHTSSGIYALASGQISSNNFMSGSASARVGAERQQDGLQRLHSDVALNNSYGRYNAGAEWENDNEQQQSKRVYANFNAGLMLTPDNLSLGGSGSSNSAVVVNLTGNASQARFNILVNEQVHARNIKVGDAIPVYLNEYRESSIKLVATNAPFADYDPSARNIVVYPGNVQSLNWHITRSITIFGKVINEQGIAIINRTIEGVSGIAITDDYGYFQAEVSGAGILSIKLNDETTCNISLDRAMLIKEFSNLGSVICK